MPHVEHLNPSQISTIHVYFTPNGPTVIDLNEMGKPRLGLSRENLEKILRDRVQREEINMEWGTAIDEVQRRGDDWMVNGERTHNIVWAHGRRPPSKSRKGFFKSGWYGWNFSIFKSPRPPDTLYMYFYPHGYVGVITYPDGESNVCGLTYRKGVNPQPLSSTVEEAVHYQPHLKSLLNAGLDQSKFQGVGPLVFANPSSGVPHKFLVGDALAVGDPFMGEGIGRALAAGPMLYHAFNHAESSYSALWINKFKTRLNRGRMFRPLMTLPWGLNRWALNRLGHHPKFIQTQVTTFM